MDEVHVGEVAIVLALAVELYGSVEAAIGARITRHGRDAKVLAARRALPRDDVHHAAERLGAEHRDDAAHDFDALDHAGIDEIQELAGRAVGRAVDLDSLDQHHHLLPAQTPHATQFATLLLHVHYISSP